MPPGYPQPVPGYGGYPTAKPPTEGMAIAALVLGIISIPGICCYGIVGVAAGVTAIVLGRMALTKITTSGGTIGGRGFAQAGWICGLVGAVLGLIIGLIQLAFLIFGATSGFGTFTIPTPTA